MRTLPEALTAEIERVKKVLQTYQEIGPAGSIGAMFITNDLLAAHQALQNHDAVAMLRSLARLKEIEA